MSAVTSATTEHSPIPASIESVNVRQTEKPNWLKKFVVKVAIQNSQVSLIKVLACCIGIGAFIGTLHIPIPVIGTIIGATLGGIFFIFFVSVVDDNYPGLIA